MRELSGQFVGRFTTVRFICYFILLPGGSYCNATWDRMQCWGYTKAGETIFQPCPAYITLSNPLGKLTKS